MTGTTQAASKYIMDPKWISFSNLKHKNASHKRKNKKKNKWNRKMSSCLGFLITQNSILLRKSKKGNKISFASTWNVKASFL